MFQLNSIAVGVASNISKSEFFSPETTKIFIKKPETSSWLNIWHAETARVSQRLVVKLRVKAHDLAGCHQ